MIIYQNTKKVFLQHILSNEIHEIIEKVYEDKTNKSVGKNEKRSWQESMRFMGAIMDDDAIPGDAGISIEYTIPRTSKRVDFIITGSNEKEEDQVVVIELKQWEKIELTNKDAIVRTRFQAGTTETVHPSYQAWSYCELLSQFNETVYTNEILLTPCAYLHNYIKDDAIANEFYEPYLRKAPIFYKGKDEKDKLKEFIKKFIKNGDKSDLMYRIENGRIKPSKSLADSLLKMIKGNAEFIMLDDQKIVFETAIQLAVSSANSKKNVLIVRGGPGTGKSVVAVNLLVNFINGLEKTAQYVSKNAAPRAVFESKLSGTLNKTAISHLFTSSGSFCSTLANEFDVLIVDEAHRLNEKSGMFKNKGENQIKEIINSALLSIFFIDENQQVTFSDVGSINEINKWAQKADATITTLSLDSQFRCGGSDKYISWLDDLLGITETITNIPRDDDYDFRVFSNPMDLQKIIYEKNEFRNRARLVAGYCWDWKSKNNSTLFDITFDDWKFQMKWNLTTDGSLWIQAPDSVSEVGCIHTCQGLEVDYIGVIIGPDLVIRNGKIKTFPKQRAKSDASLKGYGKLYATNPVLAEERASRLIKNTYRTLMTRGMHGCYIFSTDPETMEYFQKRSELKNLH